MDVINRRPGEGRYARLEREQRWLLTHVPSGVDGSREISDCYLSGTRLRLRKVTEGDHVVFKLGQKVRVDDTNPERVMITNVYLSSDEYDQLLSLAGASLIKTRWNFIHDGDLYAVDAFRGRHDGLILAEVEIGEEDPRREMPPFATVDVTNDDRYSGGRLAFARDEELRELID
jgi:CYTH domain-containing protein